MRDEADADRLNFPPSIQVGPFTNDFSKTSEISDPTPSSVPNTRNLPSFGQNLGSPLSADVICACLFYFVPIADVTFVLDMVS